jgi:hypothetical protein
MRRSKRKSHNTTGASTSEPSGTEIPIPRYITEPLPPASTPLATIFSAEKLLIQAKAAPSLILDPTLIQTMKILRAKKYSYQRITTWLDQRGLTIDKNQVYRAVNEPQQQQL